MTLVRLGVSVHECESKASKPFEHRQALHPSVANERVREREQRDNGSPDADPGVSQWSVTPLHL